LVINETLQTKNKWVKSDRRIVAICQREWRMQSSGNRRRMGFVHDSLSKGRFHHGCHFTVVEASNGIWSFRLKALPVLRVLPRDIGFATDKWND